MTTEREMLEAAAKACGVGDIDLAGRPVVLVIRDSGISQTCWNPLTNSADCAAMCAKLKIETVWFPCHMACEIVTEEDTHIWHVSNYIDHNNNPEAAWRYAATMVAAKIGGMK